MSTKTNRKTASKTAKTTKTQKTTANQKAQTATKQEEAPGWSKYDVNELLDSMKTKSAVIRYLDSEGVARADIVRVFHAGEVKMRYQHVRNVLTTPLKKEETA